MACGAIEFEQTFGGMEIINKPANAVPQELATAFGAINSNILGATYIPLWIVGKQIVNGVNYYIICKEIRSTKDHQTMIVNLVLNIPPMQSDGTRPEPQVVEIIEEADLPKKLQLLFDCATKQLIGVDYKPLAYVGKQVVHGMNYYFICEARGLYLDAQPYAVMMVINEMAGEGVSVVSIEPIGLVNGLSALGGED